VLHPELDRGRDGSTTHRFVAAVRFVSVTRVVSYSRAHE
jgi:hypothetical protein